METKQLSARIVITWPDPEWERLRYRKLRYKRLMLKAGIRPASIKRYLQKGFPSGWVRAMHSELTRLAWDMKYWGKKRLNDNQRMARGIGARGEGEGLQDEG